MYFNSSRFTGTHRKSRSDFYVFLILFLKQKGKVVEGVRYVRYVLRRLPSPMGRRGALRY